MDWAGRTLWTVGHSTRTLEELLALLAAQGMTQLADVRHAPGSRRHPHFNRASLELSLPEHGMAYRWLPQLGGRRKGLGVASPNAGWRSASFRAYADHLATPELEEGLRVLCDWTASGTTAVLCAEAVWWRCHRILLADAVTVRGGRVLHILGPGAPAEHLLTSFARVCDGRLLYPG